MLLNVRFFKHYTFYTTVKNVLNTEEMLELSTLMTFQILLNHVNTHLFRGKGRYSAPRWLPGQYLPLRVWFGRLWGGRVEPRRQDESHPLFLGGIWSPRGFWCCFGFQLLRGSCGHTEERSGVVDFHQDGLLNDLDILGQRVSKLLVFINSSLFKNSTSAFLFLNYRLTHTVAHLLFSASWHSEKKKTGDFLTMPGRLPMNGLL